MQPLGLLRTRGQRTQCRRAAYKNDLFKRGLLQAASGMLQAVLGALLQLIQWSIPLWRRR